MSIKIHRQLGPHVCTAGWDKGAGRRSRILVALDLEATIRDLGGTGDSRAYLLTGAGKLLTQDASWVNWVVERGDMTEAQAMCSPNAGRSSPIRSGYPACGVGKCRNDHFFSCGRRLSCRRGQPRL